MPRYTGTTTERGLGCDHQRQRVTALTALRDGDPCARCGRPMWRADVYWVNGKPRSRTLDLDDFPGRMYGGPQVKRLSHRSCNRRAGQRQTTAALRTRGHRLTRSQLAAIRAKQGPATGATVTRPQQAAGSAPSGRWSSSRRW